jgi:hypothetical protein
MPFDDVSDPYARCEEQCNHDLSRGVSAKELMGLEDGPKGIWHPLLNNTVAPDYDVETGEDLNPNDDAPAPRARVTEIGLPMPPL